MASNRQNWMGWSVVSDLLIWLTFEIRIKWIQNNNNMERKKNLVRSSLCDFDHHLICTYALRQFDNNKCLDWNLMRTETIPSFLIQRSLIATRSFYLFECLESIMVCCKCFTNMNATMTFVGKNILMSVAHNSPI